MTKLYISEYADTQHDGGLSVGNAMEPAITTQVVDYSGGAAASAAFSPATAYVRIHADSICSVIFGTTPTATTAHPRLIAGQTELRAVPKGLSYKVSAITNT